MQGNRKQTHKCTDVRLRSSYDDTVLAGTLVLPDAPSAAVLLLSGSGPQDRDESMAGQVPLRVLSDVLADRGIASLRCDDRGMGESGGAYLDIDEDILLEDARAQLQCLTEHVHVGSPGVIGHSQGALFALRLARLVPMHAVVLLAGAIRPGMENMLSLRERMAEDAGLKGDDKVAYLAHSRELFDAIAHTDDHADRARAVRRLTEESIAGARDEDFPDFASRADYVDFAVADAMEWEVRMLLRSRPAVDLAACPVPVLAVWGSTDRHLHPEMEHEAFGASAPAGSRGVVIPRLNHLFQVSESGAIDDYPTDGTPMRDPVGKVVADWILEHARA